MFSLGGKLVKFAFLIFFVSLSAFAASKAAGQDVWQFGDRNFFIDKTLEEPLLQGAISRERLSEWDYVSSVGGVNFQARDIVGMDLSEASVRVEDIEGTGYTALRVVGDETLWALAAPSWIVMPALLASSSDNTAMVSAFGSQHRLVGGFHLTYHPDIVDTLIGLRILQADLVLSDPVNMCPYPKFAGEVVLGAGEAQPSQEAVATATLELLYLERYSIQAWVYTDVGLHAQIHAANLTLQIQPYFSFWNLDETHFSETGIERVQVLANARDWMTQSRDILNRCNETLFEHVELFAALLALFRHFDDYDEEILTDARETAALWEPPFDVLTPTVH